ncbi:MAG: retropepsin-like aspartic protease [Bacteroidia bacterium]
MQFNQNPLTPIIPSNNNSTQKQLQYVFKKGLSIVVMVCLFFVYAKAQNQAYDLKRLLQLGNLTNDSASLACLPITYQRTDLPFVEVIIDGKPFLFLFDTGASVSMLSKEIAAGMNVVATTPIEDVTGKKMKKDLVLASMNLGDMAFKDVLCVVNETNWLSDVACVKIDGILGANLINLCNWQIDPVKGQLCLSKKPFELVPTGIQLPVFYTGSGLPILQTAVYGKSFYALMDFGFHGFVELNEDVVSSKKHKDQMVWRGVGEHSIGFNAGSAGKISRTVLDTLFLADQSLLQVPAVWSSHKPMLGASLLKRYVVTFNTGNGTVFTQAGQLFLQPISDSTFTSPQLFPLKFGLNKSGELVVKFVWQTELTQSLKVGERILKINNQEVDQLNPATWCALADEIQNMAQLQVVVEIKGKAQSFVFNRVVH